jgi:tetratricopeptide (TPR) repeat protein
MTAMSRNRRQVILREAAGYIELGELLVQADAPTPPHALKLLSRALAVLDQLPEPTRSKADARLLEGEALRAMGKWQQAIAPLTSVTEQRPERVEAWLGIGWCLKRLGRLHDAIAVLRKGLVGSPQQPVLFYNLACYHALDGNVAAAVEHLSQAIALDDRFRDLTEAEPDFDPIRKDPRFLAATHAIV